MKLRKFTWLVVYLFYLSTLSWATPIDLDGKSVYVTGGHIVGDDNVNMTGVKNITGPGTGTLSGYGLSPITGAMLDNGTLNINNFPDDLRPIKAVATLGTCGVAPYPEGAVVYLTTDYKLHRCKIDNTWTTQIDGSDVPDNVITNGMLVGAIAAAKIVADNLSVFSADMGLLTAGTIQQGYTAPGDDNTTAGAGLKISQGIIEAYGATQSFGGTILSSNGSYLVSIGKYLTTAGKTKRYPLNNETNLTTDGQIHIYIWEVTGWQELLDLGSTAFDNDVGTIGVRIRTSAVGVYVQDMTGYSTYGQYILLPSSAGGTGGIAGNFTNTRSGESIGVKGTGKYGGQFVAKTGNEGGPIVLEPSTDNTAPSHSARRGTLWVTSLGVVYVNTDNSTTWGKIGAQ